MKIKYKGKIEGKKKWIKKNRLKVDKLFLFDTLNSFIYFNSSI